jgi:hypothetical protein
VSNIPEIRTFIQRFNGSSGGFPYGFWAFRVFSAWFSAWFSEMGYSWGAGLSSCDRILRRILTSATICHHLAPSGGQMRLRRRSRGQMDSHLNYLPAKLK